jgi:hypothetical protein
MGARFRTPAWYIVLLLVARITIDIAAPQLPGAFHYGLAPSIDVTDMPTQSAVSAGLVPMAPPAAPARAIPVRARPSGWPRCLLGGLRFPGQ